MHVKYSTPNPDGENREERNERFGAETPEWDIPDIGLEIWFWYWEISKGTKRVIEGIAQPLAWGEFKYWRELTETLVEPFEWGILRDMDISYCVALSEALEENRSIIADRAAAEAEKNKGRR